LRAFNRAEAIDVANAADALMVRAGFVLSPWERNRLDHARRARPPASVPELERDQALDPGNALEIARAALADASQNDRAPSRPCRQQRCA